MSSATDTKALKKRAKELRAIVEQPSEQEQAAAELAEIEQQIAEQRDAALLAEVEARMTGIAKAHGSLRAELPEDEQRVFEALMGASVAINRLNERYAKLTWLRHEAAALADRFGVPGPELPAVVVPARRGLDTTLPRLADHCHIRPVTEANEYGRRRRSYEEIRGTEGFAIIERAGLKAFPPPTPEQQAARREREEQERRWSRYLGAAVAEVAAVPAEVPATAAGIHRG